MHCNGYIMICYLIVSFFPASVLYWSINEYHRTPTFEFIQNCPILKISNITYQCHGFYGKGPSECKSQTNNGWMIFVDVGNNSDMILLYPMRQDFCNCCESFKNCISVSTVDMKPSFIWFDIPSPPYFEHCWFDPILNRAYLQSDIKNIIFVIICIILSSLYFVVWFYILFRHIVIRFGIIQKRQRVSFILNFQ